MIKGVGVDLVNVAKFRQTADAVSRRVLARMFTDAEIANAEESKDFMEYLATRFAAKEAAYKTIAPLLQKGFDFRIIEVLNRADGSPYINLSGEVLKYMDLAGIRNIHISISTEWDYAAAFAVAED